MGGGIGMGNTCKPMAVSFQCMTKFTTNKKKEKKTKLKTRPRLFLPPSHREREHPKGERMIHREQCCSLPIAVAKVDSI